MNKPKRTSPEILKDILKKIDQPELLDSHPWTGSLFVRNAAETLPGLSQKSPGQQLIFAIGDLFPRLMPSAPPRRGKRLDTRWGEFGILAAQYFAPLYFGTPYPTSLRDGWGSIDQSILLFLQRGSRGKLSDETVRSHKLVGDEPETGPDSTISDWHTKGIQRLTEIILTRERHLSLSSSKPSPILRQTSRKNGGTTTTSPANSHPSTNSLLRRNYGRPALVRWLIVLVAVLALSAVTYGGIKAWRIITMLDKVKQDVSQLQSLARATPSKETIEQAGPALPILKQDLDSLRSEVQPIVWAAPYLRWVPLYGGDMASAPQLLDFADDLVTSLDEAYQAAQPLLQVIGVTNDPIDPPQITALMVKALPQFTEARNVLDQALSARGKIDVQILTPDVRDLIVRKIDPYLGTLDDGLTLAVSFPKLMGASSQGPQTYLIIVQNEDELRATGGFITAVGKFVVLNGSVLGLSFEDSYAFDNFSKPYPEAPWQLDQYMNIPILLVRDANWFTDFPTSALYIQDLYAYSRANSVDGIVAIDQHLLVMLLQVLGPIKVEGAPYPITADNVIAYMRAAKVPPAGEPSPADWNRKAFLNPVASAVLNKLLNNPGINWSAMLTTFFQALNERHLLVLLDDPEVTTVIQRHGWDGAVRPGSGDFLMAVDTNVGYDKTNAVVQKSMIYDVDLTDLSKPVGSLDVIHTNHAAANVPCLQDGVSDQENAYAIDRCYWNYLRVYTLQGSALLAATPHAIPAAWMILDQAVPAQVDTLDEEIAGVQGYGTLLVVPGGQTVETSFRFGLPPRVISSGPDPKQMTYSLKVQKQPGTLAIPLTVRIHLPAGAAILSAPAGSLVQSDNLLIKTDLTQDVELEVVFAPK
ncbi:MAG TPA: DUF4012 domain-containing protein [Anaerolineales bacterium]|nr:DUF4012 domain-containing protein [Anaerolineales bacterium]